MSRTELAFEEKMSGLSKDVLATGLDEVREVLSLVFSEFLR
jgi:hypothetical protein